MSDWTPTDDERIRVLRVKARYDVLTDAEHEELRTLRRRESAEVHRRRVAYFNPKGKR